MLRRTFELLGAASLLVAFFIVVGLLGRLAFATHDYTRIRPALHSVYEVAPRDALIGGTIACAKNFSRYFLFDDAGPDLPSNYLLLPDGVTFQLRNSSDKETGRFFTVEDPFVTVGSQTNVATAREMFDPDGITGDRGCYVALPRGEPEGRYTHHSLSGAIGGGRRRVCSDNSSQFWFPNQTPAFLLRAWCVDDGDCADVAGHGPASSCMSEVDTNTWLREDHRYGAGYLLGRCTKDAIIDLDLFF
jgi:hypothetical protein